MSNVNLPLRKRPTGGGSVKKKRIKWDKKIVRPFFCYDKKCKIIYSTYKEKTHKEGFSYFCYGKLPKMHVWVENKAKHENDVCHCYYTPLKGAIRYFMNLGDLWGEAWAMIAVMNRLIKPKCPKCKGRCLKKLDILV